MKRGKYHIALLVFSIVGHVALSQDVPLWCADRQTELLDWIRSWQESNILPEAVLYRVRFSVKSEALEQLQLYSVTDECEKCDYIFTHTLPAASVVNLKLLSYYRQRLDVRFQNGTSKCKLETKLREGGIYWLVFNETQSQCCLLLENDPPNIYMPLLCVCLVLMGLAAIYALVKLALRKGFHKKFINRKHSCDLTASNSQDALELSSNPSVSDVLPKNQEENNIKQRKNPARKRLRSLDTFRGACLVLMIFVNYGAGGYEVFGHVPWNGLALADLLFPWFVFIMGTAMAFSVRAQLKNGIGRQVIVVNVIRRTIILFAIGIALNSLRSSPTKMGQLRIPGVLQRLALTYGLVGLPEALFTREKVMDVNNRFGAMCLDLIDSWPQWLINSAYLAVYLALTFALPVPGCPTGYLGPGGHHEGGKYFNCTGGAAAYIDRVVFTDSHILDWTTYKKIYGGEMRTDPEGILGTLCTAFMCFLGVQSGRIIQSYKAHSQRLVRWFIWAIITGVIATILCKASKNDGWIPINKNLWSVSFTLALSSMAFILLALLYLCVDMAGLWGGQPFYYPGMNSLAIYIAHTVFSNYLPISWYEPPDHWRHLLMDVWGASFWVLVAYFLFRKKIFLAV